MCVNYFMKNRQIWGNSVVLVPYRDVHVFKYNNWMKDEALQYLTASEPLSLEEEFEMLRQWTHDCHKCTFIILDKRLFETTHCETQSMIGDINLFFDSHSQSSVTEVEVMIAEQSHRGCGKGKEATLLMMRFAVELIQVKQFIAKIKFNNNNSQQMFVKLGFKELSKSEVFEETTYELVVNPEWFDWLKSNTIQMRYHLLPIDG